MSLWAIFLHLLNLLLPAVGVALVLGLVSTTGWLGSRRADWRALPLQVAVVSAAGALALAGCLGWLGRDGKMLSYGALVLMSALTQALMLKVWKR